MWHMRSFAMIMVLILFVTLMSCGGGGGSGGGEESANDEGQGQTDTGQIETLAAAQAQAALYAAYAGIGYKSVSDMSDDAPLYGIMVADLNLLASYLVMQVISNNSTAFLTILTLGDSKTFTYQESGLRVTLNVGYNLITRRFSGDLSVDFDDKGYTFHAVTYTGQSAGVELMASLNGNIKSIDLVNNTVTPEMINVTIKTDSNLTASYPGWAVRYKGWNFSYAMTQDLENYNLTPVLISMVITAPTTDDRLYTLKGSFDIINGTTGSYTYDMTYGQQDLGSDVYVALQGSISLPGFAGKVVNVSSSGLGILSGNGSIDTASSIRRTDAGLWTSGTVTISAADDSYTATLSSDGSVTLTPGSTVVNDWQTALLPF